MFYEINKKGDFSNNDFNNEISKAKIRLTKNKKENFIFNEIRNTFNQGYSINSTNYVGRYITFELLDASIVKGHLHCFMDNNRNFLHS